MRSIYWSVAAAVIIACCAVATTQIERSPSSGKSIFGGYTQQPRSKWRSIKANNSRRSIKETSLPQSTDPGTEKGESDMR